MYEWLIKEIVSRSIILLNGTNKLSGHLLFSEPSFNLSAKKSVTNIFLKKMLLEIF